MEFEKQGSSNISSEENNEELEQVKEELRDRKRCYECTFCKRGFTNAQALGGHMNIHRKDRAKTKHNTCVSSDHQIVAPISTQPISYYPVFQPHMDYLQPSPSGFQSLTTNPQLLGPNLSLRINSTHFDQDSEVVKTEFGNSDQDVDLELRLGHG